MAWALLRWAIRGSAGTIGMTTAPRLLRRAHRRRCGACGGRGVGGDVVVAAAEVLHERMTGGEDPRRAVALQPRIGRSRAFSRPWSASIGLFAYCSDGVQRRGDQLIEHPRVDRCAVGGDLGRDRASAQRPGEEPPRRRQVPPHGQHDVDDLAILIDSPVQIRPLPGDLHIGLIHEPPVTGACRQGRAASMNSGVNRCTHRYTVT